MLALANACAPSIRPARPVSPASPQNAPSTGVGAEGGATSADSRRLGLLPDSAKSDSIDAKLRDAIVTTSAIFGVPDSALASSTPSFVDVDSTSMTEAEDSWDMDVRSYVTHDKVSRYVHLFLGTARDRFTVRLQRGKQYEGMIRTKFRAKGIPEDMYFLALVESGYDPHAYSRAAAVGMWQFMSTTARAVGLRVDWWVDERRDPVRSTDAAARFIGDLRDQFGSLYLAAAAYNGGPGRVSRGLAKYSDDLQDISGEDVFFALAEQDYLRAETKNYVPQLIAAAIIGKNPARYDIALDSLDGFTYDSVTVPASTPVAAVAMAVGTDLREIQRLNPHFLRGITPPDKPSVVRVPLGMAGSFAAQFAALPEREREAFTRVVSKKNQTLASIAAGQGVTERQLPWYNRKISYAKRGRLTSGQSLLIPSELVVAAALDVPDPSIEIYGSSSRAGRVVHVVKRGESLGSIARKYRTSTATLVRLNGLKKKVIYPGQAIIVRGGSRKTSTRSRSSTSKSTPRAKSTTRASTGSTKEPVAQTSVSKSVASSGAATTGAASKAASGTGNKTAAPVKSAAARKPSN